MDKSLLYGIIGGLVGAVIVLFVSSNSVNTQNYGMMRMMGMGRGVEQMMSGEAMEEMMHGGEGMTMDDMVANLEDLEGEEFERAFIENMIEHHEGAIEMAELIPARTERPELVQLGEAIISAQSEEIEMMQGWLRDWF